VRTVLAEAGAEDVLEANANSVWLNGKGNDVDAQLLESLLEEDSSDSLDGACRMISGGFLVGLSLRDESLEDYDNPGKAQYRCPPA
jgi:hypothetical protein